MEWLKKRKYKYIAIIFWLLFWQTACTFINRDIILASPIRVCNTLVKLVQTNEFWDSIFYTSSRIGIGFLAALLCGILGAFISYGNRLLKEILGLLLQVIKSIPVASFVIIILLWVNSRYLSVFMSFLMILPIVYFNVLKGIEETDKKMLEMAKVFQIPLLRKIRYIYMPSIMPYFVSACSSGIGFCWKSGIAAEVIGLPERSIGIKIYESKLYLLTPELFAWTIVIIILSIVFETLIMKLIYKIADIIL